MFRTSLDVEIIEEIYRGPEEVWAFVSNAEHLPEWLDEFEAVVKESDGPVGRGTVFRYTLAPGHRSATIEVVDWQPGRRLAWDGPPLRTRGGGARPRGFFELVPLGEHRTRLVSRYQPELTGILALMRPYLVRWLRRQRIADTWRLKQLLESSVLRAMSQENVEIVREANAAFNRRDLDHWIEFFDPEIEYHDTPGFPDGGMHLGREAFRRHVETNLDAWSDASVEIDARAVGKQVVGRIRYTGAGRAFGVLYDFRAGRIRRVRQFATYAEALEAAGLRE